MRTTFAQCAIYGALIVFSPSNAEADDGFVFEVPAPHIRIVIPDVPSIEMKEHPMHAGKPHLQYQGTRDEYNISVITPTAEAGMTAKECALSIVNDIARRNGLSPKNSLFEKLDDNTALFRYALPQEGYVQLNAHLLGAHSSGFCINVHVSRMSKSKDQLEPWFKGFRSARLAY